MQFYVRYQERVVLHIDDDGVLGEQKLTKKLTDRVMSLEDFQNQFDELQIEHYLNTVGKWTNNGIVGEDEVLKIIETQLSLKK